MTTVQVSGSIEVCVCKQSFAQVQRLMAAAIMRPMTNCRKMQNEWTDGSNMRDLVAQFIKRNEQLTSFQRLEIYNRQYWFRLVDALYEDFPGLRMILGQKRFDVLITEYLTQYPSASYSLRNLGSRLPKFMLEQPQLTSPQQELCLQTAEFEWAKVVAFDGEAKPPLTATRMDRIEPAALRLPLQPYVSLCELDYALDDFLIGLERTDRMYTEAGTPRLHGTSRRRARTPRKEKSYIVVHRLDNSVYFKRVSADAFVLLTALKAGGTVNDACSAMLENGEADKSDPASLIPKIKNWFKLWSEFGWFYLDDQGR